jgi:hypothetical protein
MCSSGKFWTLSASQGEGKLFVEEENLRPNVLTATCTVHGVFLDYDCTINKDVIEKVSSNSEESPLKRTGSAKVPFTPLCVNIGV